jgi:hypothetical protein
VGRLVFDTSVTPRWFESGDRFWYTFQTREGRKFYLVDPLKKTKAPLFDHAKLAATLTSITLQPYDAQHLPFTTVKFVKNDAAFQFDVSVPRDAQIVKPVKPATLPPAAAGTKKDAPPANAGEKKTEPPPASGAAAGKKDGGDPAVVALDADDRQQQQTQQTQQQQQGGRGQGGRGQGTAGAGPATPPRPRILHFEYDLATGALDLLDDDYREPRQPRWAQLSPDKKTVVFARSHNLFMMDAENFALAQKKADDPKIVEVQLTKDGEEHYSYARTVQAGGQIEQQQEDQQAEQEQESTDKNARVPAVMAVWAKDSRRFAVIRRD